MGSCVRCPIREDASAALGAAKASLCAAQVLFLNRRATLRISSTPILPAKIETFKTSESKAQRNRGLVFPLNTYFNLSVLHAGQYRMLPGNLRPSLYSSRPLFRLPSESLTTNSRRETNQTDNGY